MDKKRWTLLLGDCIEHMRKLEADSIDAIITDPPYLLGFAGKDWDKQNGSQQNGKYAQEWHYNWAKEAIRVAKPGTHLVAFGSTRTHHRLACALEDAGWEIRDCVLYLYGSGFPKSVDVSKAISKKINTSEAKQWRGWGTSLKPAWEPIIIARKPLDSTIADNVVRYGTGAINIDATRIEVDLRINDKRLGGEGAWKTDKALKIYEGGYKGTPLSSSPLGRWPANLVLSHTEGCEKVGEKVVGSGEYKKGSASGGIWKKSTGKPAGPVYGTEMTELWHCTLDCPVQLLNSDVVGASRFFYTAKASQSERNAGLTNVKNNHPTVKPLDLMRWLCVLVTPPNGIILDPFSGSGSTGCAAVQLGFSFIGIEKESDYVKIAEARIEHWSKQSIPAASRVKKYVEQKVTNQKLSEFFDV